MTAPVTHVALLDVPHEPRPFRVGWAAGDRLLAITAEFAELSEALNLARELSASCGLPIEARLRARVLH